MPTKHKLGFGKGTITEYEDGTARYVGSLGPGSFRVRIADVSSFSVTSGDKPGERRLNIIGQGTTLASVSVGATATDKIEACFRGHPEFGGNQQDGEESSGPVLGALVADELRKLADLYKEGVLTDEEFAAQKARVLSS